MVFVLAVVLSAGALEKAWPAEGGETNEKVLEVWRLFDAGETDRALQLAEGIHGAEGDSRLVLTALLGFIYEKQGRNEEALSRLDSVKPALREALLESAKSGETGEGEGEGEEVSPRQRSYMRLYVDVLRSRGFMYYGEGNCGKSVPELQEMMGVVGVPNPLALSMIGSCMYRKKEYEEAREYFQESFRWYEAAAEKGEAAYNVAAMYAVRGMAGKSAEWLRVASDTDGSRWLETALKDGDFDAVRESAEFLRLTSEP
jgi:tetratricopeptide (TPR) repeat protein